MNEVKRGYTCTCKHRLSVFSCLSARKKSKNEYVIVITKFITYNDVKAPCCGYDLGVKDQGRRIPECMGVMRSPATYLIKSQTVKTEYLIPLVILNYILCCPFTYTSSDFLVLN